MYLNVCTDEKRYENHGEISVNAGGDEYSFEIYTTTYNGIEHIFLRNDDFYARRYLYGPGSYDYSDNDVRFGMFSLACVEYISRNFPETDIIHCHEWQTGLIPVYKKLYYKELKSKTVFTVNDVSFQGLFDKFSLPILGLPWDIYNIDELEFYGNISMLKGGIAYADKVALTSKHYAEEIISKETDSGLGDFIEENSHKLESILIGIDYDRFSPESDHYIKDCYDKDSNECKLPNKSLFLKETGLKGDEKPLILIETKFSERKGLELIIEEANTLGKMPANFAFFGYGDPCYCTKFKEIANDHDNIFTFIGISESMVHLAYAAADFLLRPSLYEPCGKSHLIGMRYGALPIVRNTGGHADTVTDIADGGLGFLMQEYSRSELIHQLNRAIDFFSDKDIFNEYSRLAMQRDFSLQNFADNYIKLYQNIAGGSDES